MLRAAPARIRHGARFSGAALDQPVLPSGDHRQGLPLRPRGAAGSLSRRLAGRSRGVVDPGIAPVPALRVPQGARAGGAVRRLGRIAAALIGVACVGLASTFPTVADEPVELRRLFPQEAEVTGGGAPLSRLVLPTEVLSACRPDLSDLRLFNARDKEVPFLVDAGAFSYAESRPRVTQVYTPRLGGA